ncbi:hypothetical protein Glove_553g33 [Diversispora epigaea]|uniref:Uncharacterized protein n=1 Tax=Diversispora epigaea TaxID=1348612 RepID=A0A397GEP7_9GLOM|nr:hypothetical protein Glove_553g33 [Diversispora epigaea]
MSNPYIFSNTENIEKIMPYKRFLINNFGEILNSLAYGNLRISSWIDHKAISELILLGIVSTKCFGIMA